MTPKEKAKELLNKSMPLAHDWEADNKVVAIKIALLCVNEVISAFNFPKYNGDPETEINGDEIYWLDVKIEINLL
jgi:hypothetical protein